jgi:P-type E1-E2 ATPase
VGDILKVEDTHKFAADMVILSTSATTGKFFVMTANLDGETNLKPMSAARLTKHCRVSHTETKVTVIFTGIGITVNRTC